jgi:hypothetical protein
MWLVIGMVVVFGGFTLALYLNRSPDKLAPYSVARAVLEAKFPSTPHSAFFVSDFDDPRTSVVHDGSEIRVSGVMRTNNNQLAMNTKRAPNGEIRFTVIMEVRWKPFFQRFYRVRSTHFDTSRNTSVAPSGPP